MVTDLSTVEITVERRWGRDGYDMISEAAEQTGINPDITYVGAGRGWRVFHLAFQNDADAVMFKLALEYP